MLIGSADAMAVAGSKRNAKAVSRVGAVCAIGDNASLPILTRRRRILDRLRFRMTPLCSLSLACTLSLARAVFVAHANPCSLLERNAGITRHDMAEAERLRYMERILQHFVPNISFDVPSLRKMAENLHKQRGSESETDPSIRVEGDDFEDLAIDDEHFTIKALPDNTTRMLFFYPFFFSLPHAHYLVPVRLSNVE